MSHLTVGVCLFVCWFVFTVMIFQELFLVHVTVVTVVINWSAEIYRSS